MISVKSKEELDTEIEAIVALNKEIALHKQHEADLRDRIGEAMNIANLSEYESLPLKMKVRRFQAPTGGTFFRPNYVMNRMKVVDSVTGKENCLIPFRLMTTIVQFNSESIKQIVSDNNLSEEDSALFVADHTLREEHLRFY